MYMIFGFCYKMWAIPTGTSLEKKIKNQVKSPSTWSRTPNSVRIHQSSRTENRGMTKSLGEKRPRWFSLKEEAQKSLTVMAMDFPELAPDDILDLEGGLGCSPGGLCNTGGPSPSRRIS